MRSLSHRLEIQLLQMAISLYSGKDYYSFIYHSPEPDKQLYISSQDLDQIFEYCGLLAIVLASNKKEIFQSKFAYLKAKNETKFFKGVFFDHALLSIKSQKISKQNKRNNTGAKIKAWHDKKG